MGVLSRYRASSDNHLFFLGLYWYMCDTHDGFHVCLSEMLVLWSSCVSLCFSICPLYYTYPPGFVDRGLVRNPRSLSWPCSKVEALGWLLC